MKNCNGNKYECQVLAHTPFDTPAEAFSDVIFTAKLPGQESTMLTFLIVLPSGTQDTGVSPVKARDDSGVIVGISGFKPGTSVRNR